MKTLSTVKKNSQKIQSQTSNRKNSLKTNTNHQKKNEIVSCQQKLVLNLQINNKKQLSLINYLKSLLIIPASLLLFYFTLQMIMISTFYLSQDIYSDFVRFFSQIKHILQENKMLLLFWSLIIIKTKVPQLQRLFYHTVVKSILIKQEENQCSICLGQDCDYIIQKCQHSFHALCLQKWLKSSPHCPYCRIKVENKLIRVIPWRRLFKTIYKNKIKWFIVLIAFVFVQYRFQYYSILPFKIKQKD